MARNATAQAPRGQPLALSRHGQGSSSQHPRGIPSKGVDTTSSNDANCHSVAGNYSGARCEAMAVSMRSLLCGLQLASRPRRGVSVPPSPLSPDGRTQGAYVPGDIYIGSDEGPICRRHQLRRRGRGSLLLSSSDKLEKEGKDGPVNRHRSVVATGYRYDQGSARCWSWAGGFSSGTRCIERSLDPDTPRYMGNPLRE